MKIKICGITNLEDAKLCAELGSDAIGFIFYKQSKRYVEPRIVKEIINHLPPFLTKVGVFVNEDVAEVNSIAEEVGLNIVQLHGDETPEYSNKINLPIIKAFRIKEDFDFSILSEYKNCSFLLDSFHNDEYGGTGLKFNWDKIPEKIKDKIILAGGVSENNIKQIYQEIRPYAIDVSSSVEVKPGIKDHKRIKRLFEKYNELRKL